MAWDAATRDGGDDAGPAGAGAEGERLADERRAMETILQWRRGRKAMITSVTAEARRGPAARHNRRDQEDDDDVEDDEDGMEMTPLNAPSAEDGVQDDHHPAAGYGKGGWSPLSFLRYYLWRQQVARPAPSLQRQRQRRRCDHENYNRLTPKKGNSAALSFRFYHDSVGNHEGGDESRDFANGAAAGYGGAIACFSSEVSSLRRRGLQTSRPLRPPLPRVSQRRPRSSRSRTRGAVVPRVRVGGSVDQGTLLRDARPIH